MLINSSLEFPLTFAHWNSQSRHIEEVEQSVADTFPDHMCTHTHTKANTHTCSVTVHTQKKSTGLLLRDHLDKVLLILKRAEVFFPVGMWEITVTTPHLSSPLFNSHPTACPGLYSLTTLLVSSYFPHFLPCLPFTIIVSFSQLPFCHAQPEIACCYILS